MCCPSEIKCGVCLLVSDGYKCLNRVAGKRLPDFLLLKGNQDLSTAASILLQCSASLYIFPYQQAQGSVFISASDTISVLLLPIPHELCRTFSPLSAPVQATQTTCFRISHPYQHFFIRRVVGEGKRGADKWDRRSSKAHKFPSLKQQRDYNNILSLTLILLLEYALFRGMKYSQWIFWIGENEYQHVQVALQAKLHIQAQMCKCKQEKCISRAPHSTSFRTEKKKANKNNNNSIMPLEFTISSRNHRHIQ